MVAVKEHFYLTPEEYLEWEEKQPLKYEYMDGKVSVISDNTLPHNTLALNLLDWLPRRGVSEMCLDTWRWANSF